MWKAWTPSRHVPCTCAVPNLRQIVRGTGQSKWSHHFKDGRSHSSSSASQGNEAVYQKSGDRDHARPRRALSGKVHTPAVSSDEAAVKYLLRRSLGVPAGRKVWMAHARPCARIRSSAGAPFLARSAWRRPGLQVTPRVLLKLLCSYASAHMLWPLQPDDLAQRHDVGFKTASHF